MSISRRVYRRHSVHLRVWLEFGSDWVAGETVDASRSGVFVRIERLVKVGEQVRLRAELLDGRMLELRGVVRRVAEAGGAGAGPGLAIELVGNHPAVRAQWEAFVLGVGGESRRALAHHTGIHIGERSDSLAKDVIRAQVQAAKRRVGAGGAAQPGGRPAGRRLGARQLTIVPRSEEELAGIGDCARMGTRLYLATPEVCETGERVIVSVLHPRSDAEFALDGAVTTLVCRSDGMQAGVRIAVERVTGERLHELESFVTTGHPPGHDELRTTAERIAMLRDACRRSPGRARPFAELGGGMLIELGDTAAAKVAFERAWSLDPQVGDVAWGMALVRALDGDAEQARQFAKHGRDATAAKVAAR